MPFAGSVIAWSLARLPSGLCHHQSEDWRLFIAPLNPFHLSLACSVPWELTSVIRLGLGSASASEESNHHPHSIPRAFPTWSRQKQLREPFPRTPLLSPCSGNCSSLHPPAWDVSLPASWAHLFVNRLFK